MTTTAEPGGTARGGLTLVEVAIASAVLATLLLGVFSAMGHAMRADALTREHEAATREAMQQIDDLVMAVNDDAGFDALLLGVDTPFDVPYENGRGTTTNLLPASASPINGTSDTRAGRLSLAVDAAGTFDDGTENLVRATATVRWRGADGRDQEVVVFSMKARP